MRASLCVLVIWFVSVVNVTLAADDTKLETLSSRLASIDYVGVEFGPDETDVILHAFPTEQAERLAHAKGLQKSALEAAEALNRSVASLSDELLIARNRIETGKVNGFSADRMERLKSELELTKVKLANLTTTRDQLLKTRQLFRVSTVGSDFIELSHLGDEGERLLIPFNRVCRVTFSKLNMDELVRR